MAAKKTTSHVVTVEIQKVSVNINVEAESLEGAINYVRTFKVPDIIDFNGHDVNDYSDPVVTGVWKSE